jgi:hypothetical protein
LEAITMATELITGCGNRFDVSGAWGVTIRRSQQVAPGTVLVSTTERLAFKTTDGLTRIWYAPESGSAADADGIVEPTFAARG